MRIALVFANIPMTIQRMFVPPCAIFFVVVVACAASKMLLNFVVWYVCRANEGYSTHRTHEQRIERYRWPDIAIRRYKENKKTKHTNIPIGIKVCYLKPPNMAGKIVLHCRRRRPLVWTLSIKPKAIRVAATKKEKRSTSIHLITNENIFQFDLSRLYGFLALASSIFA